MWLLRRARPEDPRLQRIDVLIVASLVVAAAGSAIGVIAYEDDRFSTFNVEWIARSEEMEIPGGGTAGAGPGEVELTLLVTRANLTRIVFDLTLGGDPVRVQPTAVRVDIVSPANNTTSAEDELPAGPTSSIDIPIELDVGSAPDATTARGSSLEVAREALNATASSDFGVGTWTIRASFAPTTPNALGGESYTARGTATLHYYEAELSLVGPEVGR